MSSFANPIPSNPLVSHNLDLEEVEKSFKTKKQAQTWFAKNGIFYFNNYRRILSSL